MSFKNPKIILLDKPANIHSGIQRLQKLLANLPWVDCVFGLSTTGISQAASGKTEYEPEVYLGSGKYQTLLPNNFLNAHLFFKQDGPAQPVEYRPFQRNQYQAEVSIICLFNLDKLTKSEGFIYSHRYTEELKSSVVRLLNTDIDFKLNAIYDTPQDVFRGYTYDHLEHQTFKHPEAGFRIQGTLVFDQTCTPLRFVGDPVDPEDPEEPEMPIPGIPLLSFPANGTTNTEVNLTLNWSSAIYASSYQIQVSSDPSFSTPAYDVSGIAGLSTTIGGLVNSTGYYWRVRAINVTGNGSWSEVRSFTTAAEIIPVPTTPALVAPAANATNLDIDLNPLFSWTSAAYATSYQLQVATNIGFTALVFNTTLPDLSINVTGLVNSTAYYWRVRAINASGNSAWSLVRNFITEAPALVAPDAPTLVTPTDNSTGLSLTPTLSWNAAARATSYEIQVSGSPTFGTLLFTQAGLTVLSKALTGLGYSTAYYWRVRSSNGAGTSAWSAVNDFSTLAAPLVLPSIPALLSPPNIGSGQPTNPTLSWSSAANALSYQVQVSVSPSFSTTVVSLTGITATSTPVTGLVNSTTYYWRVQAANTDGVSGWSSAWNFGTVAAPVVLPDTPVMNLPANGATGTGTSGVDLTWFAAANAELYQLQVSTVSNFFTTILDISGPGLSYTLNSLSLNTTYYWRIRATNSGGASPWAAARTFATSVPVVLPSTPVLSTPANGATNQATSLTLSWLTAANATNYQVQVATDSAFTIPVINVSGITALSYSASGLSEGETYYWRVRSNNSGGNSSWSTARTFGTVAVVVDPTVLIYEETCEGSSIFPLHSSHTGSAPTGSNLNRTHGIENFVVEGGSATTWGFSPLAKVANPLPAGINTSSNVARFEIRPEGFQPLVGSSDKIRSEVTIIHGDEDAWFPSSGDVWYSFDVLFPSLGLEYDNEREAINQWFEDGSNETTLRIQKDRVFLESYNNDGGTTMMKYNLFAPSEADRASAGTPISQVKNTDAGSLTNLMVKDTWINFVFRFKHSTASTGLIEIWRDGIKIFTINGKNAHLSGEFPKWKLGLYKASFLGDEPASPHSSRVIFFDNIKVGNTGSTLTGMM
jgi:hypothetical protein